MGAKQYSVFGFLNQNGQSFSLPSEQYLQYQSQADYYNERGYSNSFLGYITPPYGQDINETDGNTNQVSLDTLIFYSTKTKMSPCGTLFMM